MLPKHGSAELNKNSPM